MQISLELISKGTRGGGGLLVADCEYDEVTLLWLDNDTLHIRYPRWATLSNMPATHYYKGRTVAIVYQAEDKGAARAS